MYFIKFVFLLVAFLSPNANASAEVLRLGTTTTTEDSGLLAWLIPAYEKKSGDKVRVTLGGTGQVLKFGRNGDVDVILSHSKSDEERFIADGFGVARLEVMYNDFVIVGPSDDPARIRGLTDAKLALRKIMDGKVLFVSRADESGTHRAEQKIWAEANLQPQGDWYLRAGAGMAEVLRVAHERGAYTLTDRGTFMKHKKSLDLELLVTGEPKIPNQYAVMAISAKKYPNTNIVSAQRFITWIVSPEGQAHIANFRVDGQQIFFSNAVIRK
jgi:tungstate transport system substrate-binding protein